MREYLKTQIDRTMPLSQSQIDLMVEKKDYFGRAYVPGQKAFLVIIQSPVETDFPEMLGDTPSLHMIRITEESLVQLEEQYNFVRYAPSGGDVPIFERKKEDNEH